MVQLFRLKLRAPEGISEAVWWVFENVGQSPLLCLSLTYTRAQKILDLGILSVGGKSQRSSPYPQETPTLKGWIVEEEYARHEGWPKREGKRGQCGTGNRRHQNGVLGAFLTTPFFEVAPSLQSRQLLIISFKHWQDWNYIRYYALAPWFINLRARFYIALCGILMA